MKLLAIAIALILGGCVTARIEKLEQENLQIKKQIDMSHYHSEFYRFDTSINECHLFGEICKVKTPAKAKECQQQVETCTIASYRHWLNIKAINKWK